MAARKVALRGCRVHHGPQTRRAHTPPSHLFARADLAAAVEGAMAAKLRNMGEACTTANRFLVQESVAQELTAGFAAANANE